MKKTFLLYAALSAALLCLPLAACADPVSPAEESSLPAETSQEDSAPAVTAKELVGYYSDGDASLIITPKEGAEVYVSVEWYDEAAEQLHEHAMVGRIEGSKIFYSDGDHILTYPVENGVWSDFLDDYKEGFFEVEQGLIKWTGSGHTETSSFVFTKTSGVK